MAAKKPSIDVTKHSLVPEHRILSKEEEEKVFEKYGITSKKLPRVRADDPVVKAINAERGNVIEITRKSATAGESKYYRVVK